MSYVNYAATNQIPVSLCIFIDVIIIIVIGLQVPTTVAYVTFALGTATISHGLTLPELLTQILDSANCSIQFLCFLQIKLHSLLHLINWLCLLLPFMAIQAYAI